MTQVISMTSAQAAQVRGASKTDPAQTMEPVPLTNGGYILGPQNIDNPAFADRKALLQSFPQVDYSVISALVPQPVMP